MLAIVAWPLVQTVILSFTDDSLRKTMNWVGWVNYDKIFNATFATVIARTFVWTFFLVLLKMILGTIGAVLLNAAVPGRHLFRILIMPPWIVPMAIGIFMWGWIYNGQFGMISCLLQRFGTGRSAEKVLPVSPASHVRDPVPITVQESLSGVALPVTRHVDVT